MYNVKLTGHKAIMLCNEMCTVRDVTRNGHALLASLSYYRIHSVWDAMFIRH